jgi:iron complex transport system substrate-binding protein
MIRNFNPLGFILCICLSACYNIDSDQPEGVRIVSLSPGITATIEDIGFGELVVGRSSFCQAVDKDVPVVGDLLEIDYERLLRLAPSDVFVQTTASGVDEHLARLAEDGHFTLHPWRVDRLEDIQLLHADLLQMLGGDVIALELPTGEDVGKLPASVLMMTTGSEGNPGLCFGRQTYLGDILELMGGTNALQRDGWMTLSLEDIGKLHPELIVVVSDSFISDASLSTLKSLHIPITPFVHKDVLIPSSKIVDVASTLQQIVGAE